MKLYIKFVMLSLLMNIVIIILVSVLYIDRPGVMDKALFYASAIAGDSDAVSSLWMYALD